MFTAVPKMALALPPLAERMRPTSLGAYIGQQHLVGPGGPLRRLLDAGQLPSLLFWGPPGVGKTTLARLLARHFERPWVALSAISSGVREVRSVLEAAEQQPGTVLFIDEIHRFNKAQQDALLHAVESGTVTLMGATTENPSFEVISALLSRCQVYVLEPLSREEIEAVVRQALAEDAVLSQREVVLGETEALYRLSAGDARKALNLVELVVMGAAEGQVLLTDEAFTSAAQQTVARYDKDGEQHYDIISAFIKSIRGSDPNAGLYWLARMLAGGEDIRFICRRLIILASEDIGNANPNALLLATSCFQACDVIGMPEARIILAQTVTYLATSPKSNAAYLGIGSAMQAVRNAPDLPVPLYLRNAPTQLMKQQGYSQGYKYSHDYEGTDANQEFLPHKLSGTAFYQPKDVGKEKELKAFLQRQWGTHYGYE